jgi:tRNA threonylcarbamoyladenosine biosynthesis protein TsaE
LKKKSATFLTSSDRETIALGRRVGALLLARDVVALVGDLGTGKTWFTKGLALGLGLPPDMVVTSPSFALINEYEGRCTLYHMDVYRLEDLSDFLSAGLEEYFHQEGVVVMEWADRWPELLPEWRIRVEIEIVEEHSRKITLSGSHPRAWEVLEGLSGEISDPGKEHNSKG